jgi:hypothetical protein
MLDTLPATTSSQVVAPCRETLRGYKVFRGFA